MLMVWCKLGRQVGKSSEPWEWLAKVRQLEPGCAVCYQEGYPQVQSEAPPQISNVEPGNKSEKLIYEWVDYGAVVRFA